MGRMAHEAETTGSLVQIWIYPVKSMRGQLLDAASIDADGVAGDRAWSVRETASGQTLSSRRVPALAEVTARADEDGRVDLDIPGEPAGLTAAAAEAALSRHLDRVVRLVKAEDGTFADVAAVHLVSTAAVAAGQASGQTCIPGGRDDPRANLIIDVGAVDAGDPGPERAWVGREITIGSAVLRITRTPTHCLGVYAEVVLPGVVQPGAAVQLR